MKYLHKAEKEDGLDLSQMDRWRRRVHQTPSRDIELLDPGIKHGCLEFFIKTGLNQTPVVASLMMSCRTKLHCTGIINKSPIVRLANNPRQNLDTIGLNGLNGLNDQGGVLPLILPRFYLSELLCYLSVFMIATGNNLFNKCALIKGYIDELTTLFFNKNLKLSALYSIAMLFTI